MQNIMLFTFTPLGAQESLGSNVDEPRRCHFRLTHFVYVTQVHVYSRCSLYIILSVTDFRVSRVIRKRKKKKLVKTKQKKNSKYVLENKFGKPIKLLILVIKHSLQDPCPGSSSLPRRPVCHRGHNAVHENRK